MLGLLKLKSQGKPAITLYRTVFYDNSIVVQYNIPVKGI